MVKFYEALKSAGVKPEAHIFSSGGHGFGMKKQGTSSDHWMDGPRNRGLKVITAVNIWGE